MLQHWSLSLLVLLQILPFVQAHSLGAPVCSATASIMVANMGGTVSQPLGFQLALNSTTFSPGTPLGIRIMGTTSQTYQGVLIWVTSALSTAPVGQFLVPTDIHHHLVPGCQSSSVTHSDPTPHATGATTFVYVPPVNMPQATAAAGLQVHAVVVNGGRPNWQLISPVNVPMKAVSTPMNMMSAPNNKTNNSPPITSTKPANTNLANPALPLKKNNATQSWTSIPVMFILAFFGVLLVL